MRFQYRLSDVHLQSLIDVDSDVGEALCERQGGGEELAKLHQIRERVGIPRREDERRPIVDDVVLPRKGGAHVDDSLGRLPRLRPVQTIIATLVDERARYALMCISCACQRSPQPVALPEERHRLLLPLLAAHDQRLLAHAEHRICSDAEGAHFGFVGIALGDFAEAGPILRPKGEAVVAVDDLGDDLFVAGAVWGVVRSILLLAGGDDYFRDCRLGVVGILEEFAVHRPGGGVASEDLEEAYCMSIEPEVHVSIAKCVHGACINFWLLTLSISARWFTSTRASLPPSAMAARTSA